MPSTARSPRSRATPCRTWSHNPPTWLARRDDGRRVFVDEAADHLGRVVGDAVVNLHELVGLPGVGRHVASHQRLSFDTLFPLLSASGLYVVEDTHTAYFLLYGGGFRRPGTIIEVAKGMVDGLHKWYFRAPVGRRAKLAWTDIDPGIPGPSGRSTLLRGFDSEMPLSAHRIRVRCACGQRVPTQQLDGMRGRSRLPDRPTPPRWRCT